MTEFCNLFCQKVVATFLVKTVQTQISSLKNVEIFFSCIYHRLLDYKILEYLLCNLNSNLADIATVDKKGMSVV